MQMASFRGPSALHHKTTSQQLARHLPHHSFAAAAFRTGPFRRPGAQAQLPTRNATQAASSWRDIPWKVSWQVNERNTVWTAYDKGSLVQHLAQQLSGLDEQEWKGRMDEVLSVLPDLQRAMHALKPDIVVSVVSTQGAGAIAQKMIELKAEMRNTNVGMLLLLHPPLLVMPAAELISGYHNAQKVLGQEVAEGVLQFYPALIRPEVLASALSELRRLVPHLMKVSSAKDWVHLLGITMRTDATLGGSDAWDPTTQSWRD